MPGTPTPRLSLVQPIGADAPSELRVAATANAVTLDNAAIYSEGAFAAIPPPGSVAKGTYYRSTDTGRLSWTNGTAWVDVLQAGVGVGQLAFRSVSTSVTAAIGQLVAISAGCPLTVTLPAPVAGGVVAVMPVLSASGASPVTVAAVGGSLIYGGGVSAASSLTLGANGVCVTLMSDGSSWVVQSGQQDTGWVALTLAGGVSSTAGYTPSARLRGDVVTLCGALSVPLTNGAGKLAATIPAGLRPQSVVYLPTGAGVIAAVAGDAATPIVAAIAITVGGNLIVSALTSTTQTVGLDGLRYRVV